MRHPTVHGLATLFLSEQILWNLLKLSVCNTSDCAEKHCSVYMMYMISVQVQVYKTERDTKPKIEEPPKTMLCLSSFMICWLLGLSFSNVHHIFIIVEKRGKPKNRWNNIELLHKKKKDESSLNLMQYNSLPHLSDQDIRVGRLYSRWDQQFDGQISLQSL